MADLGLRLRRLAFEFRNSSCAPCGPREEFCPLVEVHVSPLWDTVIPLPPGVWGGVGGDDRVRLRIQASGPGRKVRSTAECY